MAKRIYITDGNDQIREFIVPDFGTTTPVLQNEFPNQWYLNYTDLLSTYAIPPEMTVIVENDWAKSACENYGFLNVFTFEELGNKITLPNGNYILNEERSISFHKENGDIIETAFSVTLTTTNVISLPCYNETLWRGDFPSYSFFNFREISPEYGLFAGISSIFNLWGDTVPVGNGELFWVGVQTEDPFSPGGNSGEAGGNGNFDNTSEPIAVPALPTLSASDTGFITLYNPTIGQLRQLAYYMWANPLFDISAWKKIVADPMDAILGLSIIPVAVPDGGAQAVTVGNISTDIVMTRAGSQYVEVDCGGINVNEYSQSFLDYSPFSKAELYLPYCGTHPIDVDEIMGKSVYIKYHVDILSGACCAYVTCGDSVLYTFIGQCASSIPVSGGDWTNMINGLISVASSVGSMVASGGATAPTAIPALASTAINGIKPTVEKSGAISGSGAMLAIQTPYLILSRPRQALPRYQNAYTGYPSFITASLGTLKGYTEIEKIHLDNVLATEKEIEEIETLLKNGVIF